MVALGASERQGAHSRRALLVSGLVLVLFALLADHIVGGAPGFGTQQALLAAVGGGLALVSRLSAKWTRAILTLLVSCTLTLGAGELVLRTSLATEFSVIYRVDDELLHAHVPGAPKVFVHRPANHSRRVPVSINSLGFRGPELRTDTGAPRVVVMGDSNVAAEFSIWEESFCGRLQGELGDVEVVNLGVIGYGPDQSLLLLEREFERLRPQLVVQVMFADNDFGDLIRNKLFRIDARGLLVHQRVPVSDVFRRELEIASRRMVLEHVMQRARNRYALRKQVHASGSRQDRWTIQIGQWLEQCRTTHVEYLERFEDPAHAMFQDHYDADIALEPKSESAQLKLRLMRAVLERTRERCAAGGVPLLLVVLPSRIDLCDDLESPWVDRERWPDYDPRRLTQAFVRIAEDLETPYVDLFGPFSEDPCALYFRGGDSHWNEAGQALAAALVARRIRAERLLGP